MDEFAVHNCSWKSQQLSLVVNTCTMIVRLPEKNILRLVTTLNTTWHIYRTSSTLLEGVTLLGNLDHASSVCPWGRFLYCALRSATNASDQACKTCQNIPASSHGSPSPGGQYLRGRSTL